MKPAAYFLFWAMTGIVCVASEKQAEFPRDDARKLFAAQPRTPDGVRQAAEKLSAIADANPSNYDDQWHAARAWAWLADYDTREQDRRNAALKAIEHSRLAIKTDGARVEGHYYLGRSLGMLADIERGLKALGRVGEMARSFARAIEVDERFDEGGPRRLLGLLKLEAPGWPVSVGDLKEAAQHIERAVELFPDYPENQIALAKLLQRRGDKEGARAALKKALEAPPWPTKVDEDSNWKGTAKRLLGEIEK